jgi:hypothetical protein
MANKQALSLLIDPNKEPADPFIAFQAHTKVMIKRKQRIL